MSLGLPGVVIGISGATAVIDCWGTTRDVRLDPFAEVRVGDVEIEHEGAIVRRIPPEDVDDTVALYEMILAEA